MVLTEEVGGAMTHPNWGAEVDRLLAQVATLRADLDIAESRKAEAFQRLRAERDEAVRQASAVVVTEQHLAVLKALRALLDALDHGTPLYIARERAAAKRVLGEESAKAPVEGDVLGAVCMVGTLEPDEECETLDNHQHAAVQTAMRLRWERDAARGALRHAEAEVASLRVTAEAAREYLMRSVPDPNTGGAAEGTLREALADLEMTEPEPTVQP